MPVLYLVVGLPGVGKTTFARRIEAEDQALRLTPDEWLWPLFDGQNRPEKRDILEGRLVWVAYRALLAGADVVIDFGLWGRDERYALRWIAQVAGARAEVVALDAPAKVRRERVAQRRSAGTDFVMSDADHDEAADVFQPVTPDELATLAAPPAGFPDWGVWAAERWPSLPRLPEE